MRKPNTDNNVKLSRKQRSTLQLWQDQLAALNRASNPTGCGQQNRNAQDLEPAPKSESFFRV